jgi:hypothetical protein
VLNDAELIAAMESQSSQVTTASAMGGQKRTASVALGPGGNVAYHSGDGTSGFSAPPVGGPSSFGVDKRPRTF